MTTLIDRNYSMREAAGLIGIRWQHLREWVRGGVIHASCNPRGHFRIAHSDLAEFLRSMGMKQELAKLKEYFATILLGGCSAQLADSLDDLLPEGIGVYQAENDFNVGWLAKEFQPSVAVLDGHTWGYAPLVGLARSLKLMDPQVQVVALLGEDWGDADPPHCRWLLQHPVTAPQLYEVFREALPEWL